MTFSDEVLGTTTGVNNVVSNIPQTYKLEPNYPNPFNPVTHIHYQIPENGRVKLTVYNILGKLVKTLVNQYQTSGYYHVSWDAKNEFGEDLTSGIYIYQLESNNFKTYHKMILSR